MGVFENALSVAVEQSGTARHETLQERQSLKSWLLERFTRHVIKRPRLRLVERINLAPRQTVALIEADGHRLLVATSSDGAPSFYPLKVDGRRSVANQRGSTGSEVGCI